VAKYFFLASRARTDYMTHWAGALATIEQVIDGSRHPPRMMKLQLLSCCDVISFTREHA